MPKITPITAMQKSQFRHLISTPPFRPTARLDTHAEQRCFELLGTEIENR